MEKAKQMPRATKKEIFAAFSLGHVLRISLESHVFIYPSLPFNFAIKISRMMLNIRLIAAIGREIARDASSDPVEPVEEFVICPVFASRLVRIRDVPLNTICAVTDETMESVASMRSPNTIPRKKA